MARSTPIARHVSEVMRLLLVLSAASGARSAQLPIPCAASACGPAAPQWVTSGAARAVQAGNALTVTQTTPNVVLNWKSFNISSDGTVTFAQPSAAAVALNRIFQADPATILGALKANGTIYLINQNGIVFGSGAQVNVGSLIASALNITPAAITNVVTASQSGQPAFASFTDSAGNPLPSGTVQVQRGASLQAPNGQIMLFGSGVDNAGTIRADGGQVILAAGDTIYLAPSTDPNLRGLLVEVGHGGTVTNEAPTSPGGSDGGQIVSDHGDVTLTGLLVNQLGRISATTTVRENGSVYLLAQDGGSATAVPVGQNPLVTPTENGTLTLGPQSHTDVSLELSDTGTAVDATAQPKSQVTLVGKQVTLTSGSEITATSGNVSITAAESALLSPAQFGPEPAGGRLVIEPSASIDVSGANIDLPVESNVIPVQLRGAELANSPLQRNGPLHGDTVYIDTRQSGTYDGTSWVGSPIADLSGYVATIQRGVAERNLTGGTISLASDGAVLVARQAALNLSGGSIYYQGGYLNTTQLVATNGQIYDISQATPNLSYVGIATGYTASYQKWGMTLNYPIYTNYGAEYEPGYIEGKDAGQLDIIAPRIALDGSVTATTQVGPFQRLMPSAVVPGELYRPINQMPASAELVVGSPEGVANSVGPNYVVDNVTFAPGSVLSQLTGPSGAPFNPLTDPLPDSLQTLQLQPALFGPEGFGQLSVYANGTVTLPAGVDLSLSPGGSLSFKGALLDIEGNVRIPSGSVSLQTVGTLALLDPSTLSLTLGHSASIDVAGRWVNDLPGSTGASPGTEPLAINGGSVTLKSGSPMELLPGSSIDVSGGAERTANGTIVDGSGGSLSLTVQSPAAGSFTPLDLGSTLSGYAIANGGKLAITAGAVCVAASDCSGGQSGVFWAAPALFSADGFSSISLSANSGALTVVDDTSVVAHQLNLVFNGNPAASPSADSLRSVARPALLPALTREPVSVFLSDTAPPPVSPSEPATGILSVGTGASIQLDPGATMSLTSANSIFIDGSLDAPAGNIQVSVSALTPLFEFLPNQGIWLGDGARLSATGVVEEQPNNLGLPVGQVLNGGSVSITANRGYLITDPNSSIDVSGTAANLYVTPLQSSSGSTPVNRLNASSGGSIALTAAEGMLLNGTLSARAGAGPGASGGALSVTVDGNLHGSEPNPVGAPIFPLTAREVLVTDSGPVIVQAGDSVPDVYNGLARISDTAINGGGFNSVQLTAVNLFDDLGPAPLGQPQSTGLIVFDHNVSLAVPGSIRLDAPEIAAVNGANVNLSASYVGLGYDGPQSDPTLGANAAPGPGALTVQANLVDVIGTLGINGISSTRFLSTGDIRFRGEQLTSQTQSNLSIAGTLEADGELQLKAQQVYPATLTDFTVSVGAAGATAGEIDILPVAGTRAAVLSAGGQLTLDAASIVQDGTLLAPMGQLQLNATTIDLKPGSLTSTSAGGLTIPFGLTQAGADWVYPLPLGQTAVYTQSGPPTKLITLNAPSGAIQIEAGATIDLSGGGDLQASEFVPGVNGTNDVLSAVFNSTQFAIVPTLGLRFAPYDPLAQQGFAYLPGQSVTLGAGSGVAAGQYAILPASYALLPGAYLVRPVGGYADIATGQAYAQPDGSTIVAGQFSQYGTGVLQPRTQGFDVLSASVVQQEAQYNLTSANSFFSALAASNASAPPRLPQDGGQLQLLAGTALSIEGALRVTPATGGRGADVDISATQIEIVSNSGATTAAGSVALDASQLNALGAESILIGGTRSNSATGLAIDTAAASVSIDPGVQLTGTELLFTATDSLSVGAGSKVSATGAVVLTPGEYDLTGNGAFLRVSTGTQATLVRTGNDDSSGNLTIGSGATLSSSGSAILESTGDMSSQANYALPGGALAFLASKVSLGTAPDGTTGLVLAPAKLSQLGLADLLISSQSTIDVYGSDSLAVSGSVSLTSGGIQAATTDAALTLSADAVTLTGTTQATTLAPVTSSGSLTVQADQLTLGGGTLALGGFAADTLIGNSNVRVKGTGALGSDAPLTLRTAQLSSDDGMSFAFSSNGALQVLAAQQAGKAAAPAPGLGGTLSLGGTSVTLGTALRMPSGVVQLAATGTDPGSGVEISSSGVIDVAGETLQFDGLSVGAPGGRIAISAAAGPISVAAGSRLDLSGAGSQAAGDLSLTAPHGSVSLLGAMTAKGSGGEFSVDAAQIPDLSALNAALDSGGFSGSRSFEQRGAGDLILAAGTADTIRASNVSIAADGGSVDILGTIDASGTAAGSVTISAQGAIDVSGTILASASGARQSGGTVQLESESGLLDIAGSAVVDVSGGSGGAGGQLSLRVPRGSLTSLVGSPAGTGPVVIDGSVRGASDVQVEGVAIYQYPGGVLGATDVLADPSNPLFADATTFMASAGSIASALAGTSGLNVVVLPGLEIQSSGNLTLQSPWDLSTWRFNGEPGILTMRAAGNLTFQQSLSDGFDGASSFVLPATPDQSWSYRLVAGADLSASNPLATLSSADLAPGSGNLFIAPGTTESIFQRTPVPTMIRTGTGNIDIAAAGDLEFGNRASVIYTAGQSSATGIRLANLNGLAYPVDGGNITITTGGDILGALTNQLVTAWLWRTGEATGSLRPTATGWTVDYQWFEENVGALGGGNVTISAGGNIRDLSVAVPTVGIQVGGRTAALNQVSIQGGGSLNVTSDGDVTEGSFYVGQGAGSLRSWGTIGAGVEGVGGATGIAPVIALGNTSFAVQARDGLTLEGIVDPMLLPQGIAQNAPVTAASFFSTYTDLSSLSLLTTAGDLSLIEQPQRAGGLTSELTSMRLNTSGGSAPFAILPPSFTAVAFTGNINTSGNPIALWPSSSGNLDLLAGRNVSFDLGQTLTMSDTDPSLMPNPSAPLGNLNNLGLSLFVAPPAGTGHVPIHSGALPGGGDPEDTSQARIVALTGDIMDVTLNYMPKPIDIIAGLDIVNLSADIEQYDPANLSHVQAGRDISYPFPRDPQTGNLLPDTAAITVEGPGNLTLEAGRNIDLGTSGGITSEANISNPTLPLAGASVAVVAGATPENASVAGFFAHYLVDSDSYDAQLTGFIETVSGSAPSSKAAALAAFAALPLEQQFVFCQQILFDELRTGGTTAANPGPGFGNYSEGFTALNTLFPGSTSTAALGGATQRYPGGISLYFSKIYSLGSGNISLLAPGGAVDVGIATLPSAFGLTKQASDLGIVVQGSGNVNSASYGDFLVNQSRVFAADGGNILVWSTEGNIDAGRGAKTAISAPPPSFSFDAQGHLVTVFPAVLTGSGIQALSTSAGVSPGSVDLFAPHGVVNAGDAGIVAGNLTIGATAVLGRDNITVSGIAVGVPVEAGGLGASFAGASSAGASATSAATMSAGAGNAQQGTAPLAESALSWLDVFIEGFGEEVCKPSDQECLLRQKK